MSTQNNLNGENLGADTCPAPLLYANSQQPELSWPNPGKLPGQSYTERVGKLPPWPARIQS